MAHEVAYTGRDFSAEEAKAMGMVSRVVKGGREEVLEEAMKTARGIVSAGVSEISKKRVLKYSTDHG